MSWTSILRVTLSPILIIVGLFYALIMLVRNLLYDVGLLDTIQVASTVQFVSIGNITAGGTGKTPITSFLANALSDDGFSTAIISRGYGGSFSKTESSVRVDSALKNAGEIFGDEPTWFARSNPEIPVWVGANKVETAKALIEASPFINLILADDAFQHRRLKRDVDIVVIDATSGLIDYLPLPLGRGREDFFFGIRRADVIILNKVNLTSPEQVREMKLKLNFLKRRRTLLVEASTLIERLTFLNSPRTIEAAELKGKKIFLVSGIARPEQFSSLMIASTCAQLVGHLILRDHSPFSKETLSKVEQLASAGGAQYIVVTEKDAVKLVGVALNLPILVSRLQLSAPELLDAVRSRISR